jgi:putative endonuclease
VDLIGWDGPCLCFIEVKTRSQRDSTPAESTVDKEKREMLQKMAKAYMRIFLEKLRTEVPVRFDVLSVYLLPSGAEFDLYRAAFGWSRTHGNLILQKTVSNKVEDVRIKSNDPAERTRV